jgi:hypothetical protein
MIHDLHVYFVRAPGGKSVEIDDAFKTTMVHTKTRISKNYGSVPTKPPLRLSLTLAHYSRAA